jgi:hypothetical protein
MGISTSTKLKAATSTARRIVSPAVVFTLAAAPRLVLAAGDFGLESSAGEAGLSTTGGDLEARAGDLVGQLLGFVGIIYMILIIIAGVMWMTAGGNEEKVSKARKMILGATIGVIIVFSAYAITDFVLSSL